MKMKSMLLHLLAGRSSCDIYFFCVGAAFFFLSATAVSAAAGEGICPGAARAESLGDRRVAIEVGFSGDLDALALGEALLESRTAHLFDEETLAVGVAARELEIAVPGIALFWWLDDAVAAHGRATAGRGAVDGARLRSAFGERRGGRSSNSGRSGDD